MDVKLPPLGEGADSGTVVNILVNKGDQITKGQNIIELETGKAVTPIPSSGAGKVTEIAVQPGAKLSVGGIILRLEGGATAPASAPAAAPKKAAATTPKRAARPEPEAEEEEAGEPLESDEEIVHTGELPPPASPSLRRLAQDLGIDLRRIRGSENGGRIVMADLKAYIQRLQRRATQSATSTGAPGKAAKPPAEKIDFSKWGPIAKRPMSQLRKVISQRMLESWMSVARVTQFDEADISALMDLRKKHNPAYEAKQAKLTLTPFILKAVTNVLKKHPIFNTSLDEEAGEIIFKEYIHLGLAVDTDQGLIVPVIRDADKKDLLTLSKEVNELAARTRDRKVGLEELQGGTFTISNQGGIGGAHFTPIVNKPEVAILGLGRGSLKPLVKNGKIEPRTVLPLALSYDHRVIDGGAAARFITDLVAELENFAEDTIKI